MTLHLLHFGKAPVPWNAGWSGEERYEIRPCRWVGGDLALWSPHRPGEGKPLFAKPHMVRQRRSIAEMRCTVCGEVAPKGDRWWFQLGHFHDGWFMTTEAPVHSDCGAFALTVCPHLKGRENLFQPMPAGYSVLKAQLGGAAADRDFGIEIGSRRVFGSLKLAWPERTVRRVG